MHVYFNLQILFKSYIQNWDVLPSDDSPAGGFSFQFSFTHCLGVISIKSLTDLEIGGGKHGGAEKGVKFIQSLLVKYSTFRVCCSSCAFTFEPASFKSEIKEIGSLYEERAEAITNTYRLFREQLVQTFVTYLPVFSELFL